MRQFVGAVGADELVCYGSSWCSLHEMLCRLTVEIPSHMAYEFAAQAAAADG